MRRLVAALAAVAVLAIGLVAVTGIAALEGNSKQDLRQQFLSKVAEKLGVSQDQLTQAVKDARTEMIDQAVSSGRLTQEQADKLKARIEENGGAFFGPGPLGGDPYAHPCREARFVVQATAEVLHLDAQQVIDGLRSGQSLSEFAQAKGMSAGDFKAALLQQVRTDLNTLVSDGKLTQVQADTRFQRFSDNVDQVINAHPDTNDMAPCHGRGHYRQGPGNGEPGDEKPNGGTPSPTT
jgi:uncharacterized protein YidB (DUF937 family)